MLTSSSRIHSKDWMRKSITCPTQCLVQGKNSIDDSYLNFTNPLLFWREKLSWLEGQRDSISFLIIKVLIKIKLHAVKGHAQQPKAKVKILVKVWGLLEIHLIRVLTLYAAWTQQYLMTSFLFCSLTTIVPPANKASFCFLSLPPLRFRG